VSDGGSARKSTYSGSVFDPKNKEAFATDFRDFSDDDFIEAWKRACQRDRFVGHYDKLKKAKSPSGALNCTDVRQALEFFHEATGDDIFQLAAHAMTSHGFMRGGVKQAALSKLLNKYAIWASMPRMSVWVEKEKFAPLKAAKLVAAERGIPGRSFSAIVTALRKTYPIWLKSIRAATEGGKSL
jgi:hypothetical protein